MRVKLVAEKKSYQPGETARVLVLSPIEGTALVTVEREKVLRSFLVPLKADNPVIEIPLTDEDAPNAYVSVLIVKGAKESAREHKATPAPARLLRTARRKPPRHPRRHIRPPG